MHLEKEYNLRLCDFDRYGRIQPAAILDIFQEVATLQAEQMGVGRASMLAKGVYWVVVRMKYEVLRQPQLHERVIARTWPHTVSRFSFLRDYAMRAEDGETLIKATSEWVVVDARTHKFASIADIYDGSRDFEQERSFDAKPKKVGNLPDDTAKPFRIVPRYTDIDLNGHVNNAKYANFVLDALDPGKEGAIRSLQIDYRKEVLEGQAIDVRIAYADDGAITAKGSNEAGDVMFACRIERS